MIPLGVAGPLVLAIMSLVPIGPYFMVDETDKHSDMPNAEVIFVSWAADTTDARGAALLVESLRQFGGQFSNAPCIIFTPLESGDIDGFLTSRLQGDGVEIKHAEIPEISKSYFYAFKVFAAAEAERICLGKSKLLIFVDPDVVFVREPRLLTLDSAHTIACRPVMHKLIGSTLSDPPDKFWQSVYNKFDIAERDLFTMTTPVDQIAIRPYINAGLLSVRPEAGIFRRWADNFVSMCGDSVFTDACKTSQLHAIFLHQVALTAAILKTASSDQLTDLPTEYNYPLNLQQKIPPERRLKTLDDVVILRHDLKIFDKSWRDHAGDSSKIWQWLESRVR